MLSVVKRAWTLAVSVILLVVLSTTANAYEVAPMRVYLVPAEGRTNATITINNVRTTDLPVEIRVKRRIIDKDGQQSFEEAEDDFIVFPPQLLIAANQSQAIRFEYIGLPPTDQAVGYVVEVAEVPVLPPGFSGVQFAYNFGVAVYVEPPRAKAVIETEARVVNGDLVIDVRNAGNKYALLTEMELAVETAGLRKVLAPAELAELIVNPLFAPGTQRTLTVKMAGMPENGPAEAEFRAP